MRDLKDIWSISFSAFTRLWIIALVPVLLFFAVLVVNPRYPYGKRGCVFPCLYAVLNMYSQDNNGWFPDSPYGPYAALAKLYPKYSQGQELQGVAGDYMQVLFALQTGASLDGITTWHYQPGFRIDDDPRIAIIWEKVPGLYSSGKFARDSGHSVLFVNAKSAYIPGEKWPQFLKEQELLRNRVLATRARTNSISIEENN